MATGMARSSRPPRLKFGVGKAPPRDAAALSSDLFAQERRLVAIDPGAMLLQGFAAAEAQTLLDGIAAVEAEAPFRHMETPGGWSMSVAMTNCGPFGWTTSRRGYRYAEYDPQSGAPWPPMPDVFTDVARSAAAAAGFSDFQPDACLVNRYGAGARLSLHQDRDEVDLAAPIVSLSLGLPGVFLWNGSTRAGRARRIRLCHGDAVVWGGPSRLAFHGIDRLSPGHHPATGSVRYNLTFRKAR